MKTKLSWNWQYFGGEMRLRDELPEGLRVRVLGEDENGAVYTLVRGDEPVGEAWVPCGEDAPALDPEGWVVA